MAPIASLASEAWAWVFCLHVSTQLRLVDEVQ